MFKILFPFSEHEKSAHWSEKNDISPDKVGCSSLKKFWFDCPECGHDYLKSPNDITARNRGCPYCACRELCGNEKCEYCFKHSFASHPKAGFWSNKNTIKSNEVLIVSSKKYLIDCDKCDHTFEMSPGNIVRGEWCPYCKNLKRCTAEYCTDCHNHSFASHEKSKYLSEKNKLSAREIAKYSNLLFLFDCDKCDHNFLLSPGKIVYQNVWCPYCANTKLCDDENCNDCFQKSFASHPRAIHWCNDKNDAPPRKVFQGTLEKYYLSCDECHHDFKVALNSIKQGRGCHYCASQKLCNNDDCNYCFNKSLASILKIECFVSSRSEKPPRQIFKRGYEKCTFKCDECISTFENTANRITNGEWCPKCKFTTEKKLFGILVKMYPDIITQIKYPWCLNANGNQCSYDFLIPSKKILLELDGGQHFFTIEYFKKTADEQRESDVDKTKLANEHGLSMIRLLQIDVYKDINNWEELLYQAIERVDNQEKGDILNQYIANSDIYKNHIDDLKKKVSDKNIDNIQVPEKKTLDKKSSRRENT